MSIDASPRCPRCNTVVSNTVGFIAPLCPKCALAQYTQPNPSIEATRAQHHHDIACVALKALLTALQSTNHADIELDGAVEAAFYVADKCYPPPKEYP
jgi:hypothetical protein